MPTIAADNHDGQKSSLLGQGVPDAEARLASPQSIHNLHPTDLSTWQLFLDPIQR